MAFAIFEWLGLTEPTSSGVFSDGGFLDGITSTLSDLNITNGIGDGKFGTTEGLTRGQAVTLMARAMGLADASMSIEETAAIMVEKGYLKGYGNDPNNLGLDDPIQRDHMQLLLSRGTKYMDTPGEDGITPRQRVTETADTLVEENQAKTDPTYAAYLEAAGVRKGQIDAELEKRQELFTVEAGRRKEMFNDKGYQAAKGANMDAENRGLYKSGVRTSNVLDNKLAIQKARKIAAERAKEEFDAGNTALNNEKDTINAGIYGADAESEGNAAVDDTNAGY